MDQDTYKVITLGSYGVGKTCILMCATDDRLMFQENYMCTIGVDFKTKKHNYGGETHSLMIWDTAGQERYHHINRMYYRGCQGVILVYDVTSRDTFQKVELFKKDFEKHCEGKAGFVLVGNKCDCVSREVSQEEGLRLAESLKVPFLECSAKKRLNIDRIFDLMVKEIKNTNQKKPSLTKSFVIKQKKLQKSKKCSG